MAWYTDRGWMSKKNDSHGYLNSEFCDNVDMFLDFAFSNEAVVDTRLNIHGETIREIKCPCYKCQNISYRDRATVQEHLYKEGFMLRYEKWSEHGEDSICDVGQSSTAKENDDNNDSYKRMVLDNMQSHGYTPNTLKGHVSNPEAKRFYDILKAVDEPLWEGEKATKCRKLEAATSFLTWKSLYNVSTAAFNHNLSMLGRLKRMIRNRGRVEGSIVQSNLVDELSNYCSLYLESTVREARNFASDISCSSSTDLRLSIFKHPSRRLFEKSGKDKILLQKDIDKAHTYILLNCEELLESVSLYDQELKDSFPNYDEAILDEMKDKEFAEWFQKHVMNDPNKEHLRVYQLDQDVREMVDDNVDVDHFFQENERVECLVTEDLIPFSFVQEDGRLEEVEDVDSDNVEEAEFEATNLVDSDFDNNDEVDFGNEDFDDEESE
ncbi:hypothetical protein QVD17_20931 [Tagetes erecta]|uniref:Transposase-associated domain-containing protein n=1 Tax=Tagetes erecta TaxID=13708 RepID=A0AAD8KSL0_TARER|nr:hypothetical protein QVD17_20931 [Tagetes erecta]